MKLIAMAVLSILTIPAHAQRILGSLEAHQKEFTPKAAPTNAKGEVIKSEPVVKTKSSGECTEPDQTSLPLSYITGLMLEQNGKLELTYDSRAGKIKVSSPEMISNCSSMIEWGSRARTVDGVKSYSIEAKIKQGSDCVDGVCTYKVPKVVKGEFKGNEEIKVKATMSGFEDCLEKSGVLVGGKVVDDAVYPSTVNETFEGYKESGNVDFVSHGPASRLVKAKYGKFLEIDRCDNYEQIGPELVKVTSFEQEEEARISAEKAEMLACKDYEKLAGYRESHSEFASEIDSAIANVMKGLIAKSTKAIASGKYDEEDVKVVQSFQSLVVQPQLTLAKDLYAEAETLDGEDKKAKLEELKKVLTDLSTFNAPPYLSKAVVLQLEKDGRFTEAEGTNGTKILLANFARIGAKENGILVTPITAVAKAMKEKQVYAAEIAIKKEKYEVRTGQLTGQAKYYADASTALRQKSSTIVQAWNAEIASEYARMQQPNGYCYGGFMRNTQACIQDSQARIQELQAGLQKVMASLTKTSAEYEQKAIEYAKLEKEGAVYIAKQTGEEVATSPLDAYSPQARSPSSDSTYMNYTAQQQYQQPQTQQYQTQNQYNPYAQYTQGNQYQNPLGSQVYGNFNFGNQSTYSPYGQQQYSQQSYNPYGQQQQYSQQNGLNLQYGLQFGLGQQQSQYGQYNASPYGQQQSYNPYAAYSNNNFYGR